MGEASFLILVASHNHENAITEIHTCHASHRTRTNMWGHQGPSPCVPTHRPTWQGWPLGPPWSTMQVWTPTSSLYVIFKLKLIISASIHKKIKILMAKHTCDYVDLQDLTCINSILLSCLETCDLLFISMVYLSCFVRYSSDKACCSFFTHNLGGVYFTKNKML